MALLEIDINAASIKGGVIHPDRLGTGRNIDGDPSTKFLRGDGKYVAVEGTEGNQAQIDAAVEAHEEAADPHPQYAMDAALSEVALSGDYADLSNKPTLGTAAATNSNAYATAAQGTKADTALQNAAAFDAAGVAAGLMDDHEEAADPHAQYAMESSLDAVAFSGDYDDLSNKPVINKITVSSTEPDDPSVNDLWIDIS